MCTVAIICVLQALLMLDIAMSAKFYGWSKPKVPLGMITSPGLYEHRFGQGNYGGFDPPFSLPLVTAWPGRTGAGRTATCDGRLLEKPQKRLQISRTVQEMSKDLFIFRIGSEPQSQLLACSLQRTWE